MRLPEVVVIEGYGTGTIRRSVIQQPAVHNQPIVWAAQSERERIRGKILVKMDCTSVMLPALEPFEACLQRLIAELSGILPCLTEFFFAFDYHFTNKYINRKKRFVLNGAVDNCRPH